MAACGAGSGSKSKPLTNKQAGAKIAKGLKIVFLKVNDVKQFHTKSRNAPAASTERSGFQKDKKTAEDKCKDVLGKVVEMIRGFDIAKVQSPIAQKFYKEVVDEKDNYGKLKNYYNKTITPMLGDYEKRMDEYVKEGNRSAKCDYASLATELGVHLAKAYTQSYVEHSKFGKTFFEPKKRKK